MQNSSPDVIVIGAGAIGACAALHLSRAGIRVVVLEKEVEPAQHQSGRNSGVIHAGYNLKPGTLKAKFCVEGSRLLRAYCRERRINMFEGGILVVARIQSERATLAELHRRAQANGVESRIVDEDEIRRIEPCATGIEALHAPEGASFDAQGYVRSVIADAIERGARVRYNTKVLSITDRSAGPKMEKSARVRTSGGDFLAGAVVNCAGLQADVLAGSAAASLRIIPFRGYYAELKSPRRHLVRSHIYAVPDLAFPFLGAHLSRRVDGRVIVGPGAMLALGREAYKVTQVQPRDLLRILSWPGFYRLVAQPRFRRLIRIELLKSFFLKYIWAETRLLVPTLAPGDLVRSFAGIRAQVVSRNGQLVEDLVITETPVSTHVLNAVSPGLTCSLPFGAHVAHICRQKLEGNSTLS